MKGKTIVRALATGILFVVVYYVVQVIRGMYLTTTAVPDIVAAYESVDYLESSTSIGYVFSPQWIVLEVGGLIVLGVAVYLIGRAVRMRLSRG